MSESGDDNPLVVALREFYGRLVEIIKELPAPLAYGSVVVLGILVTVLLGAIIPESLMWLLGVVVLACLAAFVYVSRRPGPPSLPPATFVVYVVVHEGDDKTAGIEDAEVTIALPEPQTKSTQPSGSANFTISSQYDGERFEVNARKGGYKQRKPAKFKVQDDSRLYLSLERSADAAIERAGEEATEPDMVKPNKIRLTQIAPKADVEPYESATGSMTIGRQSDNDVQLPEDAERVSRYHGVIQLTRGTYYYRHLSKTMPTIINRMDGESREMRPGKNEEYPLRNQDHLVIGDFEFMVTYDLSGADVSVLTPTADKEAETDSHD